MLVLTRRLGEGVRIGDDICIRIAKFSKSSVRIAIDAPRHVKVVRSELPVKTEAELSGSPEELEMQ